MTVLNGKRVLITGASRGLGQSIAEYFADHDASLALLARSEEALSTLKNRLSGKEKHTTLQCDLLNLEDIRTSTNTLLKKWNGVDVIIHAAGGGLGLHNPLLSSTDLTRSFSLNVSSAVEINHLLVESMKAQGKGTIIHIGSIASGEAHGSVSYNTVKAALAAYVRSLGRALVSSGVVVTGVMPGGFIAPGNAMERLKLNNPSEYEKYLQEKLPRGSLGTPEEIIPLIAFLATMPGTMMAGCMVPIDGGEGKSYCFGS